MPVARDWTAISYYFDHDYESCIAAARRVVSAYPGFTMTSYRFMAAALGQLGRIEEARAALEKAIAMSPRMLDVVVRNRLPFFRPEDHEHMVEGLRKAGWQG
jgi:adenylate cyclase